MFSKFKRLFCSSKNNELENAELIAPLTAKIQELESIIAAIKAHNTRLESELKEAYKQINDKKDAENDALLAVDFDSLSVGVIDRDGGRTVLLSSGWEDRNECTFKCSIAKHNRLVRTFERHIKNRNAVKRDDKIAERIYC